MSAVKKEELPGHDRLKITEIFYSLQGEALHSGKPTVFIRLTGCPLRCQYCDTAYAFHGGEWMDSDGVLAEVNRFNARYVCVTGGEPLAQKNCNRLLSRLCDAGYQVSIETSGALPIEHIDQRVIRVMDIKTPGSGEQERNRLANIAHLRTTDQVKFVICDRQDYEWARAMLTEHQLPQACEVLFSASYEQLSSRELAEWILQDGLPVRFQVQLHKLLWGDQPGH